MKRILLAIFSVAQLFTLAGVCCGQTQKLPELKAVRHLPTHRQLAAFGTPSSRDVFAFPIASDIELCNSGQWDTVDNQRVWRLAISSVGAYSLNLLFTDFQIPCGAELLLLTADSQQVVARYSSDDNSSFLPTVPVPGDMVIVQYTEPLDADFHGEFSITQVAHDFRGVFARNGAASVADCHIDADTEFADEWRDERRAVCKILIGGTTLCTGVLLNTTDGSFAPYVLTARHCITTEKQARNSIFYFNYESPDSVENQYVVGASIVATKENDNGYLDFVLLRLNGTIPDDFNAYYVGWDCSETQPVGAVCIHHPDGDVTKLAIDNDTLLTASYRLFDAETFWNVEEWESGATEVGSSGAPLFNSEHRVVGILSGGDSQCGYPMNDYFQKFSVCYNRYEYDSLQLAHWLNPLGHNITKLDGSYSIKSGLPQNTQSVDCSVYPNPAHSKLFLSTENEIIASVEISDLAGVVVLQKKSFGQTEVDVSALPQGVYVCRIGFVSGNDYKCLIIKE